jgi:hypothetical protein
MFVVYASVSRCACPCSPYGGWTLTPGYLPQLFRHIIVIFEVESLKFTVLTALDSKQPPPPHKSACHCPIALGLQAFRTIPIVFMWVLVIDLRFSYLFSRHFTYSLQPSVNFLCLFVCLLVFNVSSLYSYSMILRQCL